MIYRHRCGFGTFRADHITSYILYKVLQKVFAERREKNEDQYFTRKSKS